MKSYQDGLLDRTIRICIIVAAFCCAAQLGVFLAVVYRYLTRG
jgi:hypothetical protein